MIKVGDRVRVGNWDLPVTVSRIYFEDDDGTEVFEFEAARKMLELDWGQHGKSKVAAHDEGKYFTKYQELN